MVTKEALGKQALTQDGQAVDSVMHDLTSLRRLAYLQGHGHGR